MSTHRPSGSTGASPTIGDGTMLVPSLAPMLHFVRWSPRERLAFLPDGKRAIALGVRATREWCPICRAPVANADGTAQEDPHARFRSAVTPSWCCLREIEEVRR